MKKISLLLFILFGYFFLLPKLFSAPVLAVKYSLVAPSGTLTRGQTIRFTINIDTQGATVTSGQIGMTYETQYLQYVSVTPGSAATSVSASQMGDGKIVFSGSNTSGFSGQGIFAYVDFTLIAQSSGSTELCVLWAPSVTPTPTTAPTGIAPTSPPAVTALPTTGVTAKGTIYTALGIGFLTVFGIIYFLDKRIVFKKPKKS